MKSKLIGPAKFVLFLGIGIFITWLSLRNLTPSDKTDLLISFRNVNYFWIVIVLIIGITSHLIRALRWQMLLEPVGKKPSLKNTFIAVMTGYFANLAFPRLGEVTRCGVLHTTDKIPINRSLGTVITERSIDLLLFFVLFLLLISTQYQKLNTYLETFVFKGFQSKFSSFNTGNLLLMIILGGALLLVLAVVLIMRVTPRHPFLFKIKTFFKGFLAGIWSVFSIQRPWLFALYSILIWCCYFMMTWLCFGALDQTAFLTTGAGLAVLVLGAVGIMITPGGIGLYPIIVRDTLLLYGISSTIGFAMGWILWTSQTITIIIMGIIAMVWLPALKRKGRFSSASEHIISDTIPHVNTIPTTPHENHPPC